MDSKQLYKAVFDNNEFYLPNRYKPVELIGSGSYGAVIDAKDLKLNSQSVAIKKIQNIVDEVDLKRVLREIKILKYMKHDNIVSLIDVIFVRNKNEVVKEKKKIGDIYLVTEKMDTDLYKIIKSNQELSDDHYKFIMYQILRSILFLHSAGLIHRDIKPSNVLINEDCSIKLCDFGLSRSISTENNAGAGLTEYVVTRYYRAPEVMLCSHDYSKSIDIWSAGCTFAELLSKNYLFPGENYLAQIKLIIELLGSPSYEDMAFISNEPAKDYVAGFKNIPKKNFAKVIKYNNPNAIDLLEKMITFNPNKRIVVEKALQHEYVQSIKDEGVTDPVYTGKPINFDFDYNLKITKDELLNLMLEEIKDFDSGLIDC